MNVFRRQGYGNIRKVSDLTGWGLCTGSRNAAEKQNKAGDKAETSVLHGGIFGKALRYSLTMRRRSWLRARFCRRETCIWEMLSCFATSAWDMSLKKR